MTDGTDPEAETLIWSVNAWRCFQNGVDAVSHMEAMGPVVVDHRPVAVLHGHHEVDQLVIVVSLQAEQVNIHEQSLPHFVLVTQTSGIIGKSTMNGKRMIKWSKNDDK